MTIVDDHNLLGLIERLERTCADTTAFHVEPTEFYTVAASTVCTLRVVTNYLIEMREQRLAEIK